VRETGGLDRHQPVLVLRRWRGQSGGGAPRACRSVPPADTKNIPCSKPNRLHKLMPDGSHTVSLSFRR
jgi:hypothetical protein